jgi:hypothetical protein
MRGVDGLTQGENVKNYWKIIIWWGGVRVTMEEHKIYSISGW